jgi:hypothetical protein
MARIGTVWSNALPLPGRRAGSGRGLYAQDTPFDRAEQAAGLPSCTILAACSRAATAIGVRMRANSNRRAIAHSRRHRKSGCDWEGARTCLKNFRTSRNTCTGSHTIVCDIAEERSINGLMRLFGVRDRSSEATGADVATAVASQVVDMGHRHGRG